MNRIENLAFYKEGKEYAVGLSPRLESLQDNVVRKLKTRERNELGES